MFAKVGNRVDAEDLTTFTLAGQPLTHPHNPHPLPALPRLPVRLDQGQVQILAPDA